MTKTELDTLAVMVKQSSEIALDHGLATFAERVEEREAEFEKRFAEAAQAMKDAVADTRDSAEGFLLDQVKEAVEEATRIGERLESIRSEMADEVLSSLHELTEQRNLKFEDLDEKSAEIGEDTRKIAEEFVLLNESATAALLKLSEFRKQTEAEIKASVAAELESMRTDGALISEEITAGLLGTLEKAVAECKEIVSSLEIPEPIPGEPGAPGEKGADGEPGAPGRDGVDGAVGRTLPWQPDRFYQRHSTVTHLAGLWQARSPGEGEPGTSPQWDCLARGIINSSLNEAGELVVRYSDQTTQTIGDVRGPPGREWQHKGTYDPKAWYTRADVIILRGTSYVAVEDSPGECPGPGWQMVAQAKNGPSGKRGAQGDAGPPGPIGPMGPGIRWAGAHVAGATYPEGSVVRAGMSLWVALDVTHEDPREGAVDWDLMLPGGSA